MIRCEVIKDFTLGRFDELKNIVRNSGKDEYGKLYVKDEFECEEDLGEYLMGKNHAGQVVVKVIEIIPKIENVKKKIEEIKESAKEEVKKSKKKTTKKTSKRKEK